MQGDIVLAEPGALIGFAGQRVIRDTIKQELPEGFQTAEFALEHGLIDAIVERSQMRSVLAQLLALHAPADDPGRIVTYHSVMDALSVGADAYGSVDVAPEAEPLASASATRRPRGCGAAWPSQCRWWASSSGARKPPRKPRRRPAASWSAMPGARPASPG